MSFFDEEPEELRESVFKFDDSNALHWRPICEQEVEDAYEIYESIREKVTRVAEKYIREIEGRTYVNLDVDEVEFVVHPRHIQITVTEVFHGGYLDDRTEISEFKVPSSLIWGEGWQKVADDARKEKEEKQREKERQAELDHISARNDRLERFKSLKREFETAGEELPDW